MVAPFILPAIAGIVGGGISAIGAGKAANKQLEAADKSIAAQMEMFLRNQKNIQPYLGEGKAATKDLVNKSGNVRNEWTKGYDWNPIATGADQLYRIGSNPIGFSDINTGADQIQRIGTSALPFASINANGNSLINTSQAPIDFLPINMTQEQLEATPGYQFTKNQGLKAVQNSAAARGLGSSGMAQRGAAEYVTGLADSTWQNVYAQLATERQARYTAAATDLERIMAGYERGYGLSAAERAAQFSAGQTNRETAMNALTGAYGLRAAERGAQYQVDVANREAQLRAIQDAYNLRNTERTTNFNAYQTDLANRYNRLYQMSALGSGAATGAGAIGATTAGQIGQTMVGAGNAQAAAIMGGANALAGAASDLGGYSYGNSLLRNSYNVDLGHPA